MHSKIITVCVCVLGINTEPELNAAWDVFSSFPEELNLFA